MNLPSMAKAKVSRYLKHHEGPLVVWSILAAFGAYFCTYAFRKPYTTGTFSGVEIGEIEYKTIIIIAQVIGYMLSKFIGVKVISELKAKKRITLILFLILTAQTSLILFGLVPAPYNFIFMFFNGLPLGMVWGVIFSFLEGRRFTELLGMGLSVNMIMTSGILKTIYKYIQIQYNFTDFQMPYILGFLFLPLFLFFVWMLSQIPKPSKAERADRMARKPMSERQKKVVWWRFGPGLIFVILLYAFLTTLRDFRDNFAVEIWERIEPGLDPAIFARTESSIALIVMILIAFLVTIQRNQKAYLLISLTMLISMIALFLSTKAYTDHRISATAWMIGLGISFYLPYLLVQIAFFERLIAVLKIKANAGFFVYLCDSIGYLGSVCLLLYKELMGKEMAYDQLLIKSAVATAILGFVLAGAQLLFFSSRMKKQSATSSLIQLAD